MFKKVTVLALTGFIALAVVIPTYAQTIDQGVISVGGVLSYRRVDENNEGENDVLSVGEVLPRASYFLKDNLAIGLGVGYAGNIDEVDEDTDIRSGSVVVNPFARYHIHLGTDVFFFVELSLRGDFGRYEQDNQENKFANYEIRGPIGLVIFPAKRVGLEVQFGVLGYRVTENASNGVRSSQYDLNLSMQDLLRNAAFGFTYYLNR